MHISDMACKVLRSLASLRPGDGLQGHDDKDWQLAAHELSAHGYAEQRGGFWLITPAGKSFRKITFEDCQIFSPESLKEATAL